MTSAADPLDVGLAASGRRPTSRLAWRSSSPWTVQPPADAPRARRDSRPRTAATRARPVVRCRLHDPESLADRLEQAPVVGDDEQRGRRDSRRNDSSASRAGMSRWFVGSSSSSRLRGRDAEQGQLEPRALAAGQLGDGLAHVLAAEQEAGEVGARGAVVHGGDRQERVEHRGAADGPRRGAAPGRPAARSRPTRTKPSSAGSSPGDRAQQRGLAGAVRTRRCRCARPASPRGAGPLRPGPRGRSTVGAEPGRDEPRALTTMSPERRGSVRRAAPGSAGADAATFRGASTAVAELLQPALVLVHLRVLALAPVALDELLLTRDGPGGRGRVLARARVASLALEEVRRVGAPERLRRRSRSSQMRSRPRPGRPGRERRPTERPLPARQRDLEPLERGQVEVVGGLVEQQQVGVRDEQPGQRDARLLAAGQLASGGLSQSSAGMPSPTRVSSTRWSRWYPSSGLEPLPGRGVVGRLRPPSAPSDSSWCQALLHGPRPPPPRHARRRARPMPRRRSGRGWPPGRAARRASRGPA